MNQERIDSIIQGFPDTGTCYQTKPIEAFVKILIDPKSIDLKNITNLKKQNTEIDV